MYCHRFAASNVCVLSPFSHPVTTPEAGKLFFLHPTPISTVTVSNAVIAALFILCLLIMTAPFPFCWSAESDCLPTGFRQYWSRTRPDAPASDMYTRRLCNRHSG